MLPPVQQLEPAALCFWVVSLSMCMYVYLFMYACVHARYLLSAGYQVICNCSVFYQIYRALSLLLF